MCEAHHYIALMSSFLKKLILSPYEVEWDVRVRHHYSERIEIEYKVIIDLLIYFISSSASLVLVYAIHTMSISSKSYVYFSLIL